MSAESGYLSSAHVGMGDTRSRSHFGLGACLAVALLILLGTALRVYRLGAEPLWVDEVASLRFSERSLGQIWGPDAALETNPPLYYTALHAWLAFGTSETALRSLSVVAGAVTILLTYGLGRVIGGHVLGLIAGLLVAISRVHIQYSQEARSYALLIASAMLSCLCVAYLVRRWSRGISLRDSNGEVQSTPIEDRGSGLAWMGYVLGTTAALYLHNTAVLLPALLSLAIVIVALRIRGARTRIVAQWTLANIVVLAIWGMWLPVLYKQSVSTIREFWIPAPDVLTIVFEITRLYGQPFLSVPQGVINKVVCAGGLAVVGVGALMGFASLRKQPLFLTLIATIVIGQPALLLLISLWRPMFIEKIMLWPTPVFGIVVAIGILAIRSAALRGAAFAIVVGLYGWGAFNYFTEFRKEPWDELVAHVTARSHPTDCIIFAPAFTELSFEYYYPPASGNPDRAILQSSAQELRQPFLYRSKVVERNGLKDVVGVDDRVWVIVRQINAQKRGQLLGAIHEELETSHELVDSWNFEEHIRVELFHTKKPAQGAQSAMSDPHRALALQTGVEKMP